MIALLAVLSAAWVQRPPAPFDVYEVDGAHADVSFTVRLAAFNRVRGAFHRFDGHLVYDPRRPEAGSIDFVIGVRSIDTGDEERDAELRSAVFFDAARFPAIRFTSHRVEASAGGLTVTGDLTIRDVTREVQLPVQIVSGDTTDPFGNRRVAFSSRLTINRRDYAVIGPAFWNRAISDSVAIELEIPGRIWDYTRLGWGRRPSVGQYLLARRDSAGLAVALRDTRTLLAATPRDSAMNFGSFEFQKAAGRLAQAGQLSDALAVVQLGAETASPGSVDASWLLALRAQLEARLGLRDAAAASVARSLEVDSTNTLALELKRLLPGNR